MVAKDAKGALWQTIQRQHPELAAALKRVRDRQEDHVDIDRYPAATNRWLLQAIESKRPELAKLIREKLLPDKAAMRSLFNPAVAVAVDDLIEVLIEFEMERDWNNRARTG